MGRRPGLLRLPLRPQAGRRTRPPGHRRGRGRGGADDLPLADRRADDRPPDHQAAGRRPVAAPQRQAALVQRRRPPDPLRPALRRHGLRQPVRARAPRKPRSAGPRAGLPTCRKPRPREEWIPIPVPAIIDAVTYQDASEQLARNSALSFRNNTRNDYLLRCLLTCRTCGLAMCGVTSSGAGGRASASLLHMSRQGHLGPGPVVPLPPAPDQGRGARRGRLGPCQALARRPGHAGGAVRGAGPAGRRARRRADAAGQKWEALLRRLDREEQRLLDAYQAEAIDLDELKERREQIQSREDLILTRNASRSRRLRSERDGKGGLGRPDGVLRTDTVSARRGYAWPRSSGSCSCSSTGSSWVRTRWRSAT